jgi:hypothetical protein
MRTAFKNTVISLASILACMAVPSYAAEITLNYSIGFNGHFQLGRWTPLSVVLENRSRAVSGALEVIVTSGSEYRGDVYRSIYTTDIDLPLNSKKRYSFTVIIESFTHDLVIRLRQDNDIVFSRSVNLRPHFTENHFAVVADNDVTPDILSVLPQHLYPVHVRPKNLPETWFGYESVKLLILQAETIRQLRDRQYQALVQWLRQGGYLVVGTGLNYGALGEKRVQDILPVRVGGHQQLHELKSLGQFCNQELSSAEPFLVLTARIDESKILLKENDIPIITRKVIGAGQITFLPFNFNSPPFSRWDGRRTFWVKILSLQHKQDRPRIELNEQQIVKTMLGGMPARFPDFRRILLFVFAYLILLWFFLKKIKTPGKGRWQYCSFLLLIIALFTYIGTRGLLSPGLKGKFFTNSYCQIDVSDPGTPAAATYFIGLYALQALDYRLNFGSQAFPVTHVVPEHSNVRTPNPYLLQNKDNGQYILGSIKSWSQNIYRLNLNLTAPLTGSANRTGSAMTLAVESRLAHDLIDCLIYYRKRFLFIEDIPANSRRTISVDLEKMREQEIFGEYEVEKIISGFDDNGSATYLGKTQRHLAARLLNEIHHKYKLKPESIVLVGWLQSSPVQPHFNVATPPGADVTVVNWELPVEVTL